ncbi:MAG: oxidoreductase [Flavobacteriaceae bacterium]|nr:oxidoreductase [Flavobacteriaceae bacterium]
MKKAIIIGASSGIGEALVDFLVNDGYVVGITARREELLIAIQKKFPERVFYKVMDVQQTDKIEQICTDLCSTIGGLDLMIISAGIGHLNKNLDFSISDNVVKTNVSGFTCVANWSMNYFQKQGSGHLANISSIAGLLGNGIAPSYNATKAYQINYFNGLRKKVKKLKLRIHLTDIRPGFVDTAMVKGKGVFWIQPVDKATKQIYTAILKKKKRVYITKRWALIAFIIRLKPSLF